MKVARANRPLPPGCIGRYDAPRIGDVLPRCCVPVCIHTDGGYIVPLASCLEGADSICFDSSLDPDPGGELQIKPFSRRYDLIADNLIDGHGYRVYADTSETMLRSPGFVLVLAGIFALFGKSLLVVQIVQYLMSAVTASNCLFHLTTSVWGQARLAYWRSFFFYFTRFRCCQTLGLEPTPH